MISVFLIATFFVIAQGGAVPRRYGGGKIVGGEDAAIEDVPYQAGIIIQDTIVCGGSIISNNVVVSSATCAGTGLPASYFRVRVGTNKNYDPSSKDGQIVGVVKIIIHPQYENWSFDYDISLFFTAARLVINGITVRPIELPTQGQVIADDLLVTTSGWGNLEQNGASGKPAILQKVVLPIVNPRVCQRCYDVLGYSITTTMICAGLVDEGGKDTCKGDAGGPLVSGSTLVGITSWGLGCALPGFPGVYARVPALSDWIKLNM